ncbi:MAG: hypothetical protein M1820_007237 [Bogoriella megaspora]|nr:MAG: hypothetical protein M1820_007237 [Bogoriella megaspora]
MRVASYPLLEPSRPALLEVNHLSKRKVRSSISPGYPRAMISDDRGLPENFQRTPQESGSAEQSFHFVEPQHGRNRPSQERRDVRSFVMQRARRTNPWSTSKRIRAGSNEKTKLESGEASATMASENPPRAKSTSKRGKRKEQTTATTAIATTSQIGSMVGWQGTSNETPWRTHSPQIGVEGLPTAGPAMNAICSLPIYPIEMDARSFLLVEHFILTLSHQAIPVDVRHQSDVMRTQWLALALKHRAFMHSLLATAALHAYTLGKAAYYDIIHHKAQAVREINSNIRDPVASIDDGNIAAVFSLLCVEDSVLLPNMIQNSDEQAHATKQREVHFNGLLRMIELRGGIRALEPYSCLQSLIVRYVAVNAIASFNDPYISIPYDIISPFDRRQLESSQMFTGCLNLGINEDLLPLIESTETLTTDLATWLDDPQAEAEPIRLQTRASVLQVHLLRWTLNNSSIVLSHVEMTLAIAALMFLVLLFESGNPPGNVILQYNAVAHLKAHLLQTHPNDWVAAPELRYWVVVIGTIASQGLPELDWFLDRKVETSIELGITNVEESLHHMKHILWVDRQLSPFIVQLWDYLHN